MEKKEAEEKIREIARFGTVGTTKHCRERMEERNVGMDDILNVLIWGTVEKIKKTDSGIWQFTVKGKDIDEDELFCVAKLIASANTLCITVF